MPVDVLIVLGSKSDAEVGKQASSFLDQFGVGYDMVVASAHRTPDLLRALIRNTTAKVFIAIAGMSAALPGTIAAHTTNPAIGLPDAGRMKFDANAFIGEQVEAIRRAVPAKAIIACSGGVDSATAAVLASRALGDRLLAVYIDTGLMRKGETEDVAQTLKELNV